MYEIIKVFDTRWVIVRNKSGGIWELVFRIFGYFFCEFLKNGRLDPYMGKKSRLQMRSVKNKIAAEKYWFYVKCRLLNFPDFDDFWPSMGSNQKHDFLDIGLTANSNFSGGFWKNRGCGCHPWFVLICEQLHNICYFTYMLLLFPVKISTTGGPCKNTNNQPDLYKKQPKTNCKNTSHNVNVVRYFWFWVYIAQLIDKYYGIRLFICGYNWII